MPRALRIEYPGAIYHVLNRGDRRKPELQTFAWRKPCIIAISGSIRIIAQPLKAGIVP
jgi:hypothetical protein